MRPRDGWLGVLQRGRIGAAFRAARGVDTTQIVAALVAVDFEASLQLIGVVVLFEVRCGVCQSHAPKSVSSGVRRIGDTG